MCSLEDEELSLLCDYYARVVPFHEARYVVYGQCVRVADCVCVCVFRHQICPLLQARRGGNWRAPVSGCPLTSSPACDEFPMPFWNPPCALACEFCICQALAL